MSIRWSNIAVLILAVCAVVLGLWAHRQIAALLSGLGQGHDLREHNTGLIALGMVLLTLVAIVRILVSSRRN